MSRRYTYEDLGETMRKLTALLVPTVTCSTTLLRDGWAMNITLCGKDSCHEYEFGPGLTDLQLLKLADQWKTGDRVNTADSSAAIPTSQLFVDNRNELTAWARDARRGSRVIYFRGRVAEFRADAARHVLALQSKADASPTGKPLGTTDQVKLRELQDTLDMLEAVQHLSTAAVIELMQLRLTDGSGFAYYAVKR